MAKVQRRVRVADKAAAIVKGKAKVARKVAAARVRPVIASNQRDRYNSNSRSNIAGNSKSTPRRQAAAEGLLAVEEARNLLRHRHHVNDVL